MSIELDHLFVLTSAGATGVEPLLGLDFCEGQRNIHPGQGTACRRVFFRNAYLEFLWVCDEREARSETVEPLHLWDRWRNRRTGCSPFGIVLRPAPNMGGQISSPFETWAYRPSFMAPLHIDVGVNSISTAEPLLAYTSFGKRPDQYPIERRQPLEHVSGVKEITGMKITLPPGVTAMPKPIEFVQRSGIFGFEHGEIIWRN